MKIAIIYNRESKNVINLFGMQNQEKYGLQTIKRIEKALKHGGHQVKSFEADKTLIDRLGNFMPSVVKGERPGMVFNLSYGIQGEARYTHVPSILEMVGIPYIGSGPLAHSLALDKVVTKMILKQHNIPTPNFCVLEKPDSPIQSDLIWPLIVKPKNEAVSFGIQIVHDEKELIEAAKIIFKKFKQPVLVEEFIEGREVNVGIIGNDPLDHFPIAEIDFSAGGLPIYTTEDKKKTSGREVNFLCPAKLTNDLEQTIIEISKRAFRALGCFDCARVDIRISKDNQPYILEINSLPSLGEHGSYTLAAEVAGNDYSALVNKLVNVASARYFGTPDTTQLEMSESGDLSKESKILQYITRNRDNMENRVADWVKINSPTNDINALSGAFAKLDRTFTSLGLIKQEISENSAMALSLWETSKGCKNGTLIIGNIDTPQTYYGARSLFRSDPEWLYGEGIAGSRGPLVCLEYALKALKHTNVLKRLPLGIIYYSDEGLGCKYSSKKIEELIKKAHKVIVLSPGLPPDKIIVGRRGNRRYHFTVESDSVPFGYRRKFPDIVKWAMEKIQEITNLSDRKSLISVGTVDFNTKSYPMSFPHKIDATIQMSFSNQRKADQTEKKMMEILKKDKKIEFVIHKLSERPPMIKGKENTDFVKKIIELGNNFGMEIKHETSAIPTVAGLVPKDTSVVCGIGPVGQDVFTPKECIKRISLIQRTILLAEILNSL